MEDRVKKTKTRVPILGIQSYKGGVGKSTIAIMLTLAMAKYHSIMAKHHNICVVDLDVLAPGLHHIFGSGNMGVFGTGNMGFSTSIVDFFFGGNNRNDVNGCNPRDICHKITSSISSISGIGDSNIFLVPCHPDIKDAQCMLGYLLGEIKSGLIHNRLNFLLKELQRLFSIDLFILDCPPGLFGMSSAVRGLVQEHDGIMMHVANLTKQDLIGSKEMLENLPDWNENPNNIFLLNKTKRSCNRGNIREEISGVFPQVSNMGFTEEWLGWLEHFKISVIPESDRLEHICSCRKIHTDYDSLSNRIARLVDIVESNFFK